MQAHAQIIMMQARAMQQVQAKAPAKAVNLDVKAAVCPRALRALDQGDPGLAVQNRHTEVCACILRVCALHLQKAGDLDAHLLHCQSEAELLKCALHMSTLLAPL